MGTGTNPLVWSKWQWRGLLGLSLAIAAFIGGASLSHLARASNLLHDWPTEEHGWGWTTTDSPRVQQQEWTRLARIAPGGAAAQAGLKPGDLIRSAVPGVSSRPVMAPGAHLPLMVDRGGTRFRVEIVAQAQPPVPAGTRYVLASQGFSGLVSTGLGVLLLLLRGRRSRAAAMLGMVLQCLGWIGGYGSLWAPAPIVAQAAVVLNCVTIAGLCYFLPLAGLEVAGGGRSPAAKRLVHLVSALLAGAMATLTLPMTFGWRGADLTTVVVIILLSALLSLGCIVGNYRHNDALARNRIKIVLLAFTSYMLSFALFVVAFAGRQSTDYLVWALFASAVFALAGPALIAYAVLRQRLFDLNFALNRTLVYGALSFILLAAFGLAEWAIEHFHFIPETWHEGGAIVSAGIALALFLSFHRLRDWVERHIERVFFRPWHRNEEALRRFVAAAGHFDQTPALCGAFAAELSRFARGAGAALYLRDADGTYDLGCGNLAEAPPEYAGDDLALALMRAERQPLRTAEMHSALPGTLALPMLDHGRLAGFALLAGKPDGTDYRPDEIEVLGWAAHQVGLDLQAMRASELEAAVARLNEAVAGLRSTNAQLSGERDRLATLLASPAPRRKRPIAAGSPGS